MFKFTSIYNVTSPVKTSHAPNSQGVCSHRTVMQDHTWQISHSVPSSHVCLPSDLRYTVLGGLVLALVQLKLTDHLPRISLKSLLMLHTPSFFSLVYWFVCDSHLWIGPVASHDTIQLHPLAPLFHMTWCWVWGPGRFSQPPLHLMVLDSLMYLPRPMISLRMGKWWVSDFVLFTHNLRWNSSLKNFPSSNIQLVI